MARTKKSKWRAGRLQIQEAQKEAAHGSNRLPESKVEADVRDVPMDLGDAGGVSVDMSQFLETKPPRSGLNITDEEIEMDARYLQQPIETLQQGGDLWKQPPANSLDKKPARGSNGHVGIPVRYNHTRRILSRHWKCGFDRLIPDEMRKQTPYSLALLIVLRRLASNTKNNYTLAQAAILKVWCERIGEIENPDPEWPYRFVETHPQLNQQCESSIQENIYGLMIEDVGNVRIVIKKFGAAKQASREVAEDFLSQVRVKKSRVEKQSKKAAKQQRQRELREKREQRERAQFAANQHPGNQPQSFDTAPPNSPVTQPSNKFGALSKQFTLTIRTRSQLGVPTDRPQVVAPKNVSRQEKKNYESMARLMTTMGVKHSARPVGKKRLKKLTSGGLSRGAGGVSLPSERMDLGNISALSATEPVSSEGEDAAMDGVSLLDLPD